MRFSGITVVFILIGIVGILLAVMAVTNAAKDCPDGTLVRGVMPFTFACVGGE